ncbi:zinc-binding dehydrogenase-domain-containing protein [Auriculariales sp. MPI-PUGE-AT-0066]|nr:zinc-binding dehydrogenase-domain-containing protein [Auriculariales sp. MPI-PUGE-AT-0066]
MIVPKFHAIIDAVGLMNQTTYIHSADYLQPNGVFVTTFGGPKGSGFAAVREVLDFVWAMRPVFLGGVNRKWKAMLTKHKEQELLQLAQWMEEGKLKPVVDSVFEFDDVLNAYEKLMGGHAKGKVVVRVNPQAK